MKLAGKLMGLLAAVTIAVILAPASAFAELPTDSGLRTPPITAEAATLADELPASYLQVDLSAEGILKYAENGITEQMIEGVQGILLTGTPAQLESTRFCVDFDFEFTDDRPVGRACIDALAQTGADVKANLYLDDTTEPLASFKLKCDTEAASWTAPGDQTADILGRVGSGHHRASLGLSVDENADPGASITVLLRSVEFAQNSLPVVYFDLKTAETITEKDREKGYGTIDEMNASSDHSVKTIGTMRIQVPAGYVNEYGGQEQASYDDLRLDYIRGRGNSTWANGTAVKKPYKFKLKKNGDGTTPDLFGMGANKHWVLITNAFDNSLVKNRMTLWLGNRIGLEYTPKCIPVELVMNGVYCGSYLLAEQVRVDENRVAISGPSEDFEKTGYLLSWEQDGKLYADTFTTQHDFRMLNVSPSIEDNGPGADAEDQISYIAESLSYVRDYVQRTEDAIFGENFKDSDGKSYTEFLDLESMVKYHWVQEFSKNGDAYGTGSTYFYKKGTGDDGAGKLYFGPLWDFDYAWNTGAMLGTDADAERVLLQKTMPWVVQLMGDDAFLEAFQQSWVSDVKPALSELSRDGGILDAYYAQTQPSWAYDKEKYLSLSEHSESGDDAEEQAGADDESGEEADFIAYRDVMASMKDLVQRAIVQVDNLGFDASYDALKNSICKVTFDLGEDGKQVVYAVKGQTLGYAPQFEAPKGALFIGWKTDDGKPINLDEEFIDDDMTLYPLTVDEKTATKAQDLFFGTYEVSMHLSEGAYAPSVSLIPADAQNKIVRWKSSDENVVTIGRDGTAYSRGIGTAVVTGTLASGASKSYVINVCADDVQIHEHPSSAWFENPNLHLTPGQYGQIVLTGQPEPLGQAALLAFFTSSDESVAMVDEIGVVTALKPGTARLTAAIELTGEGWHVATCTVTVTNPAEKAVKKANPITVKTKKLKVKAAKLKKKNVKVAAKKAFKVSRAKGQVTFKMGKITCKKKLAKQAKKKIRIAKNGRVTLKKGLKKGTYKVAVTVAAAGNANFAAKNRTVKLKVVVK